MAYYAALDVSTESTSICIVDREGAILHEGKAATEPRAIHEFLQSTGLPLTRVGLEAGNLSIWLYHDLLAAGVPVVCLETRHANAVLKTQKIKTDRNDARGLAQIVRTGWYKAVHVKSHASQKLRVLLNNRRCLLDKRMDVENQIRGTLKVFGMKVRAIKVFGMKVRAIKTRHFEDRVRELLGSDAELEAYIVPLLDARRYLQEQVARLEKMLIASAKQDAVCRRLMTIPGVGVLTALLYKSSIDQPERFRKSKDVGAALGLTPRKYASGEVNYDGHINKAGDKMLRHHRYEAALSHMVRSRKWSALKSWGMRIAKRSSMKNACVAVARKLAAIMHRIWLDGTEFKLTAAPAGGARRSRCARDGQRSAVGCRRCILEGARGAGHSSGPRPAPVRGRSAHDGPRRAAGRRVGRRGGGHGHRRGRRIVRRRRGSLGRRALRFDPPYCRGGAARISRI